MKIPTYDARRALHAVATAAAVTVLSLSLAACGEDGDDNDDAAGETAASTSAQDARLQFAQCMREHGVDMDDPGPDGRVVLQAKPGQEDVMRAAQEACQEYLDDAMPEDAERGIPPEQKEALLAAAECMRDRGWNVPDPEFDGGRVLQRVEPGSDLDPDDPRFQQDQEECAAESGVEEPGQQATR
jgi:hypothetical protein